MAAKYASYAKAVKDLLQKPFSYDNKVELKTKAANGTSFTSDVTIAGKDGSAKATVQVAAKRGAFSVDKVAVSTDKKVLGEFTFADVSKGTDVQVKFTDGSRAAGVDTTANVVAEYRNLEYGSYTADFSVLDGIKADLAGVFKYREFLIGANAKVNTTLLADKPVASAKTPVAAAAGPVSLGDVGFLLGYTTADFTLVAQTKKVIESVDLSLTHNASSALTAGFLATVPLAKDGKPAFTIGGSYKVDADTTVYAAADEAAKVSFAYKQKLNSIATVTVSTQIATASLGSDDHKFGLTLSLTN